MKVKIYLQKFIDANPLIERDIRFGVINSIENLKNYKHHDTANYKMNHKETIDFLEIFKACKICLINL